MKQNIAFIGAHRTGKTTLAKAVCEATGVPYVPISTSQVFKDNGLDPSDKLDIWTRFDIQKKILLHACDIWFDMDQQFICDRTPLDMLAYMLADIQANSIGVISEEDIEVSLAFKALLNSKKADENSSFTWTEKSF